MDRITNIKGNTARIITCRALLNAGVSLKDLNAEVSCKILSSDMYLNGTDDSNSFFGRTRTIDPFFSPVDSTVASSSSMSPQ